ncbi:MAG: hypothetical protein U0V48_01020 [Anaerolineales bacterium]
MLNALRGLFREKYLNIQAKLVFPLAITILLLVAVLSPLTNRIINSRIEQDADRRLSEVAKSVGALIENSESVGAQQCGAACRTARHDQRILRLRHRSDISS